jgi:hypothetical protein
MEHRWNSRTEINSTVTVYPKHFGAVKAMVKNISKHGMLLETDQFSLAKGGVVELAYTAFRKVASETVRLKALTIHASGGLAGLMFIENAGDFAALCADSADDGGDSAPRTLNERSGITDDGTSAAGYSPLSDGVLRSGVMMY